MERNELKHHGTKGMKWGVRRYQNKDGTLTPAGKKRYDSDVKDLSTKKKQSYKADPDKWVKEDLERTRRLTDESAQLAGKLKNANDSSMRNRKRARMNLSSMSDQEMRNKINRELLERQYNDVFNPQKVSRGRAYTSKILDGAVTALGVTSSALGIALAIKQLRS